SVSLVIVLMILTGGQTSVFGQAALACRRSFGLPFTGRRLETILASMRVIPSAWHNDGQVPDIGRYAPGEPRSFTARGITATSPSSTSIVAPVPIERPLRASSNLHYFQDASGHALILCGSQTWNTLQDWGTGGSVQPLDFNAFVGFLKAHGHNFTLLWRT